MLRTKERNGSSQRIHSWNIFSPMPFMTIKYAEGKALDDPKLVDYLNNYLIRVGQYVTGGLSSKESNLAFHPFGHRLYIFPTNEDGNNLQ